MGDIWWHELRRAFVGIVTSLVNELRQMNGVTTTLGFANPVFYTIGGNAANYAAMFHDIADGSTNLYYPAVVGYDMSTGWGTFIGDPLLNYLGSAASTAPVITSFSPGSGSAGTLVTVTGVNLTQASAVAFNGYLQTSRLFRRVRLPQPRPLA